MLRSMATRAGSMHAQLPNSAFRSAAGATRGFRDRRYVRLAGMTSYASRDDVILFMQRNGVDVTLLTAARDLRFAVPARSHTWPSPPLPSSRDSPVAGAVWDEGARKEAGVGRDIDMGDVARVLAHAADAHTGPAADAAAADANVKDTPSAPDVSAASNNIADTSPTTGVAAAGANVEDAPAAADVSFASTSVTDGDAVHAIAADGSAADARAADADPADADPADASAVDAYVARTAHDVPVVPLLAQGQTDIFQNTSVWFYDAGSKENADDAAAKLSGKICGLKIIRAATVDANLVGELVGASGPRMNHQPKSMPLRRRMSVIAPLPHERDRAILLMGLPPMVPPRSLWAFFGTYDVAAVRLLRKERVASVVFRSPDEARRAIRERANMQMHEQGRLQMKFHA